MSSFYERPLRSDELYHWKYKNRYRKGDHWVYVYDDGSMSEYGTTKSTYQETDPFGNTNITETKVITNPNRWTSKKSTSESTVTTSVTKDGRTSTKTVHTTAETVERGKLHIMKMNLARKISELPGDVAKAVKKRNETRKKMFSEEPKDKKSKAHRDWEKKYNLVSAKR